MAAGIEDGAFRQAFAGEGERYIHTLYTVVESCDLLVIYNTVVGFFRDIAGRVAHSQNQVAGLSRGNMYRCDLTDKRAVHGQRKRIIIGVHLKAIAGFTARNSGIRIQAVPGSTRSRSMNFYIFDQTGQVIAGRIRPRPGSVYCGRGNGIVSFPVKNRGLRNLQVSHRCGKIRLLRHVFRICVPSEMVSDRRDRGKAFFTISFHTVHTHIGCII